MIIELLTLRDIKRLWGMLRRRTLIGPKYVMVDIINNCDLQCIMCVYHSPLLSLKDNSDYRQWKSGLMKYDTFALLVSDLFKMKTEFIRICGAGEPFLHPDIKKMLTLMVKYNFRIHIMTNGINLDKEMIDYLIKIRVERLTFSIHAGSARAYGAIHPMQKDSLFNLVRGNLAYLKMRKANLKVNYPKITIINVISRLNYCNLSDMVSFAESVDADRVCFKPLEERAGMEGPLSLGPQHIKMIVNDSRALRKGIKLEHNMEDFVKTIMVSKVNGNNHDKLARNQMCYLHWYRADITTEGKVIGCIYQRGDVLGDITKMPFNKIWNSREYMQHRKNMPCPERCLGEAVYPFVRSINNINRIKNRLFLNRG